MAMGDRQVFRLLVIGRYAVTRGYFRRLQGPWVCQRLISYRKVEFTWTINSLLKNSFGLSFRGALRHGISLFVGFWRGGIHYSVRDGVFRSLFQQTANRAVDYADAWTLKGPPLSILTILSISADD